MKSCPRKILFIFGFLLIFVFLFVPYRSTHIKYQDNPHSLVSYKITTHQSGYVFVFKFLKLKSNDIPISQNSVTGTEQDSYFLNKTLFWIEVIIIIVLASLDYFLLCVVFKKKKMPGT
jgi:hypothetical protein